MVKSLLVRKEKYSKIRDILLSKKVEFFEENKGFHSLFVFPGMNDTGNMDGQLCYLVDESIEEVKVDGKTFKIDAARNIIDNFAPKFENENLRVKLENPDVIVKIRRWGKKYLISVS